MTNNKSIAFVTFFLLSGYVFISNAQTINWKGEVFEISNVKTSIVQLNGDEVLKVERDLETLPFSIQNLASTVDEPTFVKLKDVTLADGVIEVKALRR